MRATRAEINTRQFRKNIQHIKSTLDKNCALCLTVKANAYGHGLTQMSNISQDIVDMFAVAAVDEGIDLRNSGITKPILVLSAHLEEEIPDICRYNLTPIISHDEFLGAYQYWAEHFGMVLNVHLKIDTGMGRTGVSPSRAKHTAEQILLYSGLRLEGICTHFANSDDTAFTAGQLSVFNDVLAELPSVTYVHTANSGAILNNPASHFNMVRAGIAAYGYAKDPAIAPVLALKSKITVEKLIPAGHSVSYDSTWTADKDTKIGVIPIGYADGYFRALSNKAFVLVDGRPCSVLGRVCMDQIVVELPADGNYMGKDVILYNDSTGLNADIVAGWAVSAGADSSDLAEAGEFKKQRHQINKFTLCAT